MARNYSGGSYQTTALTGNTTNASMFVWGKPANITDWLVPIGHSKTVGDEEGFNICFRGDVGGDPIQMRANAGAFTLNSSSSFSASSFQACGIAARNASGADVYLNGTKTHSATTVSANILRAVLQLGANVGVQFMNGDIFGAAVWSTDLSDAEFASLAKGFPARRIRPQSLISYIPLVRTVFDVKAERSYATSGSGGAVAVHGRSYGI